MDYQFVNIRTAAILTNEYVPATILNFKNVNPSDKNQLIIDVYFTIGALTDCQIKIEFSHNGTNYVQETADSAPSSGVVTESVIVRKLTATGNYRITLPIKDNHIKISAIGTGTVTNSSLALDAKVGVV